MDDNFLLIAGAIAVAILLLILILAGRRRQRVELGATQPAALRTGLAEGRGVADEAAAATKDVAGEILGVEAHPLVPPAGGPADDLQRLKGVGPKLAAQLNAAGITRYEQLAGLSENEIALLDERMGAFRGRVARDRLAEQAHYLARGDTDGFEARFGKLGGG
jgi:predicted flap endonuclease-1-like 5' DNA nuclease